MSHEPPNLRDADVVIALLRNAAEAHRSSPLRLGSTVHLPSAGHLLVTGDLHDNNLNFQRIIKLANLDPPQPQPQTPPEESPDEPALAETPCGPATASQGERHLILHEVIHGPDRVNGMDLSIRILARCADLKLRHPDHVHILLSNHELAQMRSEGITKDGVSVCEIFDDGINFLYGDAGQAVREAVSEYVAALPLAVKCANGVMISHSLPAPRRIEAFDKTVIDRQLTPEDLAPHGSAYDMVWGRHQTQKITEELAEAWGVAAFVVGHQPAEMGYETVAQNTIILASDHSHGVALSIDLARQYTRDQLVHGIRALAGVPV